MDATMMKAFARLLPLLLAASLPVAAGRINVTADTTAFVHSGAEVEVHFGTGSYHSNPSLVSVEISAQLEPWFVAAALPSGTGEYYDGLLFEGWLVSRDGSISVPLFQDAAFQLGLPLGSLLLTPGTYVSGSGSEIDVAVMSATVQLDGATSAALFAGALGSYNDAAMFRFRSIGDPLTIGLGEGYIVRNAITEQVGDGSRWNSGVTGAVMVENPEPGTWALFAGALLLLGAGYRRRVKP
jgi:hypothetical protein